jgi:hypothetical protein
MARKRKSYGEVKLKRRSGKIQRYVYTRSPPSKMVRIKVFVTRSAYAVGQGTPGYQAWACPHSSKSKASRAASGSHAFMRAGDRCGPYGYGRTPTRAVEAALVALGKSGALRKGGR